MGTDQQDPPVKNVTVSARKLLSMIHYGLESTDPETKAAAESAASYMVYKFRSRSLLVPPDLTPHVARLAEYHAAIKADEPI